jgi:hypothetical protein
MKTRIVSVLILIAASLILCGCDSGGSASPSKPIPIVVKNFDVDVTLFDARTATITVRNEGAPGLVFVIVSRSNGQTWRGTSEYFGSHETRDVKVTLTDLPNGERSLRAQAYAAD